LIPRQQGAELSPGLVPGSRARELMKRFPARKIDKLLIFAALALAVFGILMIYSATRADTPSTYYLKKQLAAFLVAVVAMLLMMSFDYRKLMPYSRIIYAASIFLLIVAFIFHPVNGTRGWIPLFFFDLQPSELAKVVVIIALATFIADRRMDLSSNKEFLKALAIAGVPMLLIFLEPDFGMTMAIFLILIVMLMVGGARLRQVGVLVVGVIGAVALAVPLGILKGSRLTRLLVFINPNMDPLQSGYNLNQSKIAIGSGQLVGKGLFQGTQTNLKFIPAHHTDFIFSVVGEELGFIGGVILLTLFGLLLWRCFKIGVTAKDTFGTMLVIGVVSMFFFGVLINMGMTMGIMPVTGLTLPFMSYGGTSLLVNFIAIGLVLNVGMRRFQA
jgi:rod shape determining protein RodA